MKNTIEVNNEKGIKFKSATCVLVLIAVIYVALVGIFAAILTKNLNGKISIVEVTVKKIDTLSDTHKLISEKGETYMISSLKDKIEWETYVGKTVTIITPYEQLSGDPWILGLVDGDEIVIDYNETIEARKSETTILLTCFSAFDGLLFVAGIVFYILYRKTPKTQEQSVDEFVWKNFATELPKSPKRKKVIPIFIACFVISVILLIVGGTLLEKNESTAPGVAFFIGVVVFLALDIFTSFYISFKYLPREDIKYYKENYPFNADDVSHLMLKKDLKAQFNEQNRAERVEHPDNFFDMGNAFEATFKEDGLFLYYEDLEMELETTGVFDELDDPNAEYIPFEYTIPYEKLNLVAVPKYRKYANMFGIIIKSRINESESMPNEIKYDVHFLLDSNLLTTLKKFNIEVEGLDYLLNNVEQLMQENCKKAKSGINVK